MRSTECGNFPTAGNPIWLTLKHFFLGGVSCHFKWMLLVLDIFLLHFKSIFFFNLYVLEGKKYDHGWILILMYRENQVERGNPPLSTFRSPKVISHPSPPPHQKERRKNKFLNCLHSASPVPYFLCNWF